MPFLNPDGTPAVLTPQEQTEASAQISAASGKFMNPDGTPAQLTPQEQAEAMSQVQPARGLMTPDGQQVDPATLSSDELADMSEKTGGQFSLPTTWNQLPEASKTPEALSRFSEAHDKLRQVPFYKDLPSASQVLGNLGNMAVGLGKLISNSAKGVALAAGGYPGQGTWMDPEKVKEVQQGVLEGWSGTESAVTGLASQVARAAHNLNNPTHGPVAEGVPAEVAQDIFSKRKQEIFLNSAADAEQQSRILSGKGQFVQAVAGEKPGLETLTNMQQEGTGGLLGDLSAAGYPVRPEEAAKLAAADPFSWYAFGKAFEALPAASKALVPKTVSNSIAAVSKFAADKVKDAVGGTAELAGKATAGVGKLAEKTAEPVGAAATIAAAVHGHFGALLGLLGGEGGHSLAGATLTRAGKLLAKGGENLESFGRGVAEEAATGPVSQLTKDVIEAAPAAASAAAKGAALDVALQGATAETPEEKAGFAPIGTVLGGLHGIGGVGKWVLSGQIAGAREIGAKAGIPNSAKFPELNTLHNRAVSNAPPRVREQIRAIQQLKQGVAPNTDVFYVPHPAAGEADALPGVLSNLGMSKARSFELAGTDGVTTEINGRNVVIFRDVSAAPHEVQHAMDLVLGQKVVDNLNAAAKADYGDLWNSFTRKYAERLNGGPLPEGTEAGDFILDRSGYGAEGARQKNADPSDWRNNLTDAEKQTQLDRYIGGEIRAENSDAYFKRSGNKAPSFLDKMFVAAGNLSHILSGKDPLEGRVSEGLGLPIRSETFQKAGKLQVETRKSGPAAARPVVRPKPANTLVPQTVEELQQNASDARQIANTQATTATPGESATAPGREAQSPHEALGIAAEAIAGQTGVRVNYRGAEGATPTGGAEETEAAQRRQEIEAARNLAASDRNLFERLVFPYKVEMTGKGPQLVNWSPVNLAANAFRWAKSIAELAKREPNAPELKQIPFGFDYAKGEFSKEGWHDLLVAAQKFSANQLAGFTGAGEPLVVPAGLESAGVHAPIRTEKTAPSPQEQGQADFINMLYGQRPPETPRVSRKSGVPLNVVGQKVAEATGGAERIVEPAKIHAKKKQAATLGVEPGTLVERAPFKEPILGVSEIKETNPLRGALETALQRNGVEIPGMTQVTQRLNLEHIHSIDPEPNLPQIAGGNQLSLAAGFMPVRDFIDRLHKSSPDEWLKETREFKGKYGGGQSGLSFEVGAGATNRDEVAELRSTAASFSEQMRAALKNKDLSIAASLASKAQAAQEAYESATGTGGVPDFLRKYHPEAEYTPPMPENEPAVQALPRNPEVAKIADDYAEEHGLPALKPLGNAEVKPALARKLADFLDEAKHAPEDAAVKKSYEALTRETKQQYEFMRDAGYTIEPWTGAGEPYKSSAEMTADVRDNKHLFFRPTDENFSGGPDNLLLQPSGIEGLSNNDLFRAVHDFFGHAKEGHQFGPRGEFNAWREHSEMFSPEAQGALAAETLAQNSWVNFGKHLRNAAGEIPERGQPGFIPAASRPFAEQKNFVVPGEMTKWLKESEHPAIAEARAAGLPTGERDPKQKTYLRIGNWDPKNPLSKNYAMGKIEAGLSVYELDAKGNPIVPSDGEWAAEDLADRMRGTSQKFLVQGDRVGVGHDGEILLSDPKVVGGVPSEMPSQFKPRNKEKEIELRHWSNVPGLRILDPKFHGTGLTGEERARARDYKKIYVPRTYFGTKEYSKEPNLGPEQYRAFVKEKNLYPFQEDPKDLWPASGEVEAAGYAPMDSKAANTLYEKKIFDAGYEGYVHRDAHVVAKFTKTPVENVASFLPSSQPRALRAAAVRDPETGQVFEGPFHAAAIANAMGLPQYKDVTAKLLGSFEHGFTTNQGEFLSRDEATTRAREMEQLMKGVDLPGSSSFKSKGGIGIEHLSNETLTQMRENLSAKPAEPAQFKPAGPPKLEDFTSKDKIEKALARPGWALLTATEEKKGLGTDAVNVAANEELAKRLNELGHDFVSVSGSYKGVDQGKNFLITGISPQDALALGKEFNQESVLVPQGLLYQDGSLNPTKPEDTTVGAKAEKNDFVSRIEGGPAFSLGINFGTKLSPEESPVTLASPPKPEQSTLAGFEGTKEPLSTRDISEMSIKELKERYPEALVVPDKENNKPVGIPSDITQSPLFKRAGSEEDAVKVFATRLADFARQWEDNPAYQDGLKWYSEFEPMLKKQFGKDAQLMAELLAATSPQNNPENNFAIANDALEMFRRGRFDKQINKFEEGLAKLENGTWEKWYDKELKAGKVEAPPKNPSEASYMAHWIDKFDLKPKQSNGKLYNQHSVPVLQVLARRWLERTAGPKTQNFIKNLIGTGHEATYDVWADRTLRRIGYSGHGERWRILPKNAVGVTDEDFHFGQKVFSQAARELGVKPSALQGALWFAEKQLWADNGWGRLDLGDFRKEVRKVEMLNRGIEQRLATTTKAAEAATAEPLELGLVEPRKMR